MTGPRFLLDESADARIALVLQSRGHEIKVVAIDFPSSLKDEEVLDVARRESRTLITDDRDFGELVVRRGHPHAGVIYLRLGSDSDLSVKIERLDHVLTQHGDELDRFRQ